MKCRVSLYRDRDIIVQKAKGKSKAIFTDPPLHIDFGPQLKPHNAFLSTTKLKYFSQTMGTKGFFQFEIIINVFVSSSFVLIHFNIYVMRLRPL